jgi:hypothetical protein
MEYIFSSYEDFLNEYQNYRFDECSVCHSICELEETLVNCYIEGRRLIFPKMLILRCKSCGATFLPEHTNLAKSRETSHFSAIIYLFLTSSRPSQRYFRCPNPHQAHFCRSDISEI